MSRPLSVASVIEKNKVVSDTPFLILLDIKVVNPNTLELVETVRVVQNNENLTFNGNLYVQANFKLDITQSKDDEPSITLAMQDQTLAITERVEAYAGGTGFEVTMYVVNADRLDQPPEISETFKVKQTSAANYVVSFTLGSENLLGLRFPPTNQFRDRCRWRYKSVKCGYAGAMASCDYTYDGSNGCEVHANTLNYGGFRGLRPLNL